MSGTRRLTASRVELLADEKIVGPTIDDVIVSAPAVTGLGNNPSVFPFTCLSTNILAASPATPLSVIATGLTQRYFDPIAPNIPYNSRLTASIDSAKARLSSIFGMGLKGTVKFEAFLSSTAPVAVPSEITIGLRGQDSLGNSWNKIEVVILPIAPAAIGQSVQITIPLVLPHLASRTHLDFFADCDNTSAVTISLNGATITYDISQ